MNEEKDVERIELADENEKKRKKERNWFVTIGIVAYILLGYYVSGPKIAIDLLRGLALALPVVITTFIIRNEMSDIGKLLRGIFAAYLLFHKLISDDRIALLVLTIVICVLIAGLIYSYSNIKKYDTTNLLLAFVISFDFRNQYDSVNPFFFVLPAIFCGGIACVITFAILKKKDNFDGRNTAARVFAILSLVGVISFFVLGNINYIFDSSEPRVFECVVSDKEYINHRKSADDYILYLDNGQTTIEIEVSSSEYDSYRKGDKVTLYIYDGALGSPYYTIKEKT